MFFHQSYRATCRNEYHILYTELHNHSNCNQQNTRDCHEIYLRAVNHRQHNIKIYLCVLHMNEFLYKKPF